MTNPFLINPAVAGTEDYTDIRAGYRKQWTGLDGSPRTMYLSSHTNLGKRLTSINKKLGKKNGYHGIGGIIINDAIGYTTTTSLNLAYAYHLRMSETLFASLGLMGGLNQFAIDRSKVTATNPTDPLLNASSAIGLGDISLGGWLYSTNLYLGASLSQVAPPIRYSQASQQPTTSSTTHYFLTTGYKIPLSASFQFVPSFYLKGTLPSTAALDLNAKIRYKEFLWAGISYRSTNAAVAIIGVVINNMVDISYSFDYTTSPLTTYTGYSHEVVIGFRLKSKPKIECPSSYW